MAKFASGIKTFSRAVSLLDAETFFNRASTRIFELSVIAFNFNSNLMTAFQGAIDNESELKLRAFAKTLTFKQLRLFIADEQSCGQVLRFL